MIHVIYFNQWFSSIVPIMQDLKNKFGNELKIVASSKNPDHAYKNVVDEFIVEDWDEEAEDTPLEYCNWLKNTLNKCCADIAFIYRHQDWVANHISIINETRATVVLDTEALDIFANKQTMYEKFKQIASLKQYVPKYWDLTDQSQFDKVINMLDNEESGLCLKLNSDVGGESFRKIVSKSLFGLDKLKYTQAHRISHSEASCLLDDLTENQLKQIIFMEYLHGPEISADCYRSKVDFICVCRVKTNGRTEQIYSDEFVHFICKEIANTFDLKYPFNVQFRFNTDTSRDPSNLKITDINLRLSGGSYLELAAGINLCEVCILDILNKSKLYDIDEYTHFKERSVTHYEIAIEL